MTGAALSFAQLLKRLHDGIAAMSDPRQASNAMIYSPADVVLGAFVICFM